MPALKAATRVPFLMGNVSVTGTTALASSGAAPRGATGMLLAARYFSASAVAGHHVGGSAGSSDIFAALDTFPRRHNACTPGEVNEMLKKVGVTSLEDMVDKMVPKNIRLTRALKLVRGSSNFSFFSFLFLLAHPVNQIMGLCGDGRLG